MPAVAAVLALAAAAAVAQAPHAAAQATGPPPARDPVASPILLASPRGGAPEPSLLPVADQEQVERVRSLVRARRFESVEALLQELEARHPDDIDVLLARAEYLARTSRGAGLLEFLEQRERVPAVAKALAGRPGRAGLWLRLMAEAYGLEGRYEPAVERVIEAWSRSPEQSGWARMRLQSWAPGREDDVARALARAAERQPARTDLALEVARHDVRLGRIKAAVTRLERAERAAANETRDADAADPTAARGRSLWQLAMDFGARGHSALADSLLLALARGEYDPALRAQAVDELFGERRSAAVAWIQLEPEPVSAERAAEIVAGDHERTDDVVANAARRLELLEAAWRGLPPSAQTLRLRLDLSARFRRAGDAAGAERVAAAVEALAGRAPETAREPDLAARMELRQGESALAAGDLDAAARRFAAASRAGAAEDTREESEFLRAEVLFYAGRFDSAAQAYESFMTAFPASRRVNDALDRAYLIEAGAGGRAGGLAELAEGLRQWRAGRADEAGTAAQRAEGLAQGGPVAAHAALLRANIEESRGRLAEAAAIALAIAQKTPEDRLAPVALRRAGDLFRKLGDDARALAQYEDLLVRYPRSWLAPETRRMVSALRARGATP